MAFFSIGAFKANECIMALQMWAGQFKKSDGGIYFGWMWVTKSLTVQNLFFTGYLENTEMVGYTNKTFSKFGTLVNFNQNLKEGDQFTYQVASGDLLCRIYKADPENSKVFTTPVLVTPPQPRRNTNGNVTEIDLWQQKMINEMNQDAIDLINY
ncbi:MAG: hypothetical protein R2681_02080 [Pyrinomonadaceae bacterium]